MLKSNRLLNQCVTPWRIAIVRLRFVLPVFSLDRSTVWVRRAVFSQRHFADTIIFTPARTLSMFVPRFELISLKWTHTFKYRELYDPVGVVQRCVSELDAQHLVHSMTDTITSWLIASRARQYSLYYYIWRQTPSEQSQKLPRLPSTDGKWFMSYKYAPSWIAKILPLSLATVENELTNWKVDLSNVKRIFTYKFRVIYYIDDQVLNPSHIIDAQLRS